MYFYRTVRDRTATFWRRCSVAVDIVVDCWHCRPDVEGGVRLLGRIFFFHLAKKFIKQTVR